jgi:hypothetical protein
MNEELIQAINDLNPDGKTSSSTTEGFKQISCEMIFMIFYSLQPRIRSKIKIFNVNKNGKLPEIILRSIYKCKR